MGKDEIGETTTTQVSSFLTRYRLQQKANTYNGYSGLLRAKEKLIFQPTTIKTLREGIEYFESPDKPPNKISEQALAASLARFEALMKLYGLTGRPRLPDSVIEKNKIWKEQVAPRLKDAKELKEYLAANKDFSIEEAAGDIEEFILGVREENQQRRESAAKKLRESKKKADAKRRKDLGLAEEADVELAAKLIEMSAIALREATREESGYLYFKVWRLPDDTCWYKIGISNNLQRRDAEQNVLPVPAKTLGSVRFASMSLARVAESAFHETLRKMRIVGANNKELFHLKPQQAQAVLSAIEHLKNKGF